MAFSKPWQAAGKDAGRGLCHQAYPQELKTGTGKTWYDSYKAKYKVEPYASYGYNARSWLML